MESTPIGNAVDTVSQIQPTYLSLDWVFYQIYAFFHSIGSFLGLTNGSSGGFNSGVFVGFIKLVVSVFVCFFVFVILYSLVRLYEMHHEDAENKKKALMVQAEVPHVVAANTRWQKIIAHTESESNAEWRLAIIDADAMLDDLTKERGLVGDTMADRLKQAKWTSINDAWEAHKVRNRIAHDGFDFELSKRETRRIITMYERVFQEFGKI